MTSVTYHYQKVKILPNHTANSDLFIEISKFFMSSSCFSQKAFFCHEGVSFVDTKLSQVSFRAILI